MSLEIGSEARDGRGLHLSVGCRRARQVETPRHAQLNATERKKVKPTFAVESQRICCGESLWISGPALALTDEKQPQATGRRTEAATRLNRARRIQTCVR